MTDDRQVRNTGLQLHYFFELVFFELVLESIPAGLVYGNPGFEIKKTMHPPLQEVLVKSGCVFIGQ